MISAEHGMLRLNLQTFHIFTDGELLAPLMFPPPPPPAPPEPLAGPCPPEVPGENVTCLTLRGVPPVELAERGVGDDAEAGEDWKACKMDSGSTRSVSTLESHPVRKSIHAAVAAPEDAPGAFEASVIRPVSSARKILRSVD
jgi:hypothetical protein